MAFYPITGLTQQSKRITQFEALRSQSEGGYMFSRKKFTKPKYKFELEHLFNESDFETLNTFFETNQGTSFDLVFKGITYRVIFGIDELSPDHLSGDVVKTKVTLVEV